jgi:hypothetical protein
MGKVVDFKIPRAEIDQAIENELRHGDGGGPTEIVVRVVFEEPEAPEPEPEPQKSSDFWPAVGGFLLGFWLGG